MKEAEATRRTSRRPRRSATRAQDRADGFETEREALKDQIWALDAEFEESTVALNEKFEADLADAPSRPRRRRRRAASGATTRALAGLRDEMEASYAADRAAAKEAYDAKMGELEVSLARRPRTSTRRRGSGDESARARGRGDARPRGRDGVEAALGAARDGRGAPHQRAARARGSRARDRLGDERGRHRGGGGAAASQPAVLRSLAEAASAPLPDVQTWREFEPPPEGDVGAGARLFGEKKAKREALEAAAAPPDLDDAPELAPEAPKKPAATGLQTSPTAPKPKPRVTLKKADDEARDENRRRARGAAAAGADGERAARRWDKALDTSPSPSPPPTTPTPPAAAAPLFRKGQSVWYASTPKTSHDALVLEDAAAGAATAEAPKKSRGGGARAAEAPKKSRSGARKPRPPRPRNRPGRGVEKASKQAAAAARAPPPAGGDDDWLVEGSPWIGTRLMRTVFDFDAHAAATKAGVAFEPQSLASREGRAGGARKVAVDQCACDAELAGDVEDLEEHELEECQGQPKDVDELEAGAAADYDAVLAALRTEVRSIPIGAIGRGAGGTGVRVSEETRDRPRLARLLAAYGRAVLPRELPLPPIQVNANYRSAMHCDGGNVGASAICAFGDFTGGNLWTHDRGLLRVDGASRGARYFNGNMPHMTMPFDGERYSLIYFCCGNWGSLSRADEAALCDMGFRFPPEASKAFEYEYGFQIHEDHIIEAALTNYSLWRDRFSVGRRRARARDARPRLRAPAPRAGADVSDVVPGLVLGANARLAWDCFAGEGANMACAAVGWRHLKQPLGGCVLYCERRPRSEAFVFGVFYDDGDFEELSLQLAGKVRFPGARSGGLEPAPGVSKVVGGHHMAALGLLPPAPAPVPDKWLSAE
ncbi:acetylcholine-gated cation-selective channel [Aureococcus anophagefferens]|uniref:Acetylcholine-gated cation-selective channel n=1 Tax=Aureococcus anophagefferens TaxID=44056 RepID=A0ABR1FHC5_AURAN